MRSVNDKQRRRLLAWSALLCAIPVSLAPLAGRTSFELASEQAAFGARFSAPQLDGVWSDKAVSVLHDPFIAEAGEAARGTSVTKANVIGAHVTQGESTGITVPVGGSVPQMPFTVTAVVTGVSPRALVDDGARVRVVGVGDPIAGSRVISIDGSGVHLQSGVLVPLAEDHL